MSELLKKLLNKIEELYFLGLSCDEAIRQVKEKYADKELDE